MSNQAVAIAMVVMVLVVWTIVSKAIDGISRWRGDRAAWELELRTRRDNPPAFTVKRYE